MSFRFRIILGFLLIVVAGFFWLARWLINDLRPHYLKSMEESLVDQATVLASIVSTEAHGDTLVPPEFRSAFESAHRRRFTARIYDYIKTHTNVRVYITDATGLVVFDSDEARDEGKDYSQWNDVYRTLRGSYGARATRADEDDPATAVLHVAAPILLGDSIAGVLAVSKPAESVNRFVEQSERKIIGGALIATLTVVLLGALLSTWLTLPIRRLTEYARAVRDGKRAKLPPLGGGEVAVMGNALEQMRETLEGKQYVEQYVQTLTHQIKNPLSAIRGAAELLDEPMPDEDRRHFAENVRDESNRIQDIVDRLLQLSALESRTGLREAKPVDLSALVRETADSLAPTFAARDVRFERSIARDITATGEPFMLRQALVNLLQNALDFSPAGSTVHVALESRDGSAVLTVSDEGPGIPSFAVERVFERFYSLPRPDTKRKSTGLGLSIVLQVAELHGGKFALRNCPERGTQAEFAIPSSVLSRDLK
jgi:two-component system, OmpR family, sensor histidine kinase CreC